MPLCQGMGSRSGSNSSGWGNVVAGCLLCGALGGFAGCGAHRHTAHEAANPAPAPAASGTTSFVATAYSSGWKTASGTPPQRGIVAADPAVLPLGSRIRVRGAGSYSGDYVVRDTGGKIQGRKIDIYIPKHAQAKRFGRRHVKVEVLQYNKHGNRRPAHRHRVCTRHCRKRRRRR